MLSALAAQDICTIDVEDCNDVCDDKCPRS